MELLTSLPTSQRVRFQLFNEVSLWTEYKCVLSAINAI
jgi:hypothetical protein